MKTNFIINTKTLTVESEVVYRKRWSQKVSFSGELTKRVVSQLDPDCVLCTVPQLPVYDDRFQIHYLSDPIPANGTYIVKWEVRCKDRQEINAYLNKLVEDWIDSKAVERGYSNQDRMIGYIGDPNPTIDQEARYMRFWRSSVWNVVIPRIEAFLNTLTSPSFKPISIAELKTGTPEFLIPTDF